MTSATTVHQKAFCSFFAITENKTIVIYQNSEVMYM